MSMIWPWSSQACAISDIRNCRATGPIRASRAIRAGKAIKAGRSARATRAVAVLPLFILLSSFLLLLAPAYAGSIQAGEDIQAAIDSAQAGDAVLVSAGTYNATITVNKPLAIVGVERPRLFASIQNPAFVIKSDGVSIEGFDIYGVREDSNSKFNYYMMNREAAAGERLDLPNSAIVVEGDGLKIINTSIYGAQAGVYALDAEGLRLENTTLNSCDTGLFVSGGEAIDVSGCIISNCSKYGLNIEYSRSIAINNNSIVNSTNAGILIREAEGAVVDDNLLSGCIFGLSLWNASYSQVRRNSVDHNYYGILVTNWSNYNNITENLLINNSRGEITAGFGIGLSLQENSTYNLVVGNTAEGNYNGLEVSKGCQFNAVYGNNASKNRHGIRMNENRNNLIFGNNFIDNDINAYENTSRNIWNTTTGNYYSSYQGSDENGDGIGDEPYALPGPESTSLDYMPSISPLGDGMLGLARISELVGRYATLGPEEEDEPFARVENGVMVISSQNPGSPAEGAVMVISSSGPSAPFLWPESESFGGSGLFDGSDSFGGRDPFDDSSSIDPSRPPFYEEIDF